MFISVDLPRRLDVIIVKLFSVIVFVDHVRYGLAGLGHEFKKDHCLAVFAEELLYLSFRYHFEYFVDRADIIFRIPVAVNGGEEYVCAAR